MEGSDLMATKKITMQMIADVAGYSKYVVSKTLNSKPGVSESTRQKILFVAKQLGYFKNNPMQGIKLNNNKSRHEGFVLVIMPNHRDQNAESLYWSKIFNGIIDYLESLHIGVMVISSQNNLSEHVKTNSLLGIITVGLVSTDMLLELNKHNVPIVMVDHEDSIIKADTIFVDNIGGLYKLTNHLIGLGHKDLYFIGDTSFSRSFYDRWLGFRSAMENHNLFSTRENCILNIEYNNIPVQKQFHDYLNHWKEKISLPTAFICANDQIAESIMEILIDKGYDIPKDFSVTGFDNLGNQSKLNPPLSTIRVLKEAIGKRAVSMLLWRLDNLEFPAEKIEITCEMVIRKSVSYPPK